MLEEGQQQDTSPVNETEVALRRAAQAMSSITDVASRFLEAYIRSGGTWSNLGRQHINKAYDLAIEFMVVGEERWAQRMQQIMSVEQPTGGGGGVDESLPMDDPTVN